MIVEHVSHPQFLSNTYLVADGSGGPALFIDAGGPVAPLIATADRLGLEPTHVLLTHHHFDHVSDVPLLRERWPGIEVLMSASERDLLLASAPDRSDGPDDGLALGGPIGTIDAGTTVAFGGLEVWPLHTPGHSAGMLSLLIGPRTPAQRSSAPGGFSGGEGAVFTGDTLFRDSVGGVRAPGHTTYTDLKDSIMGTLMELPGETVIHPGHAESSTVAREWEHNPFIRIWRGLDPEGSSPCTALGLSATLILLARDYDGGKKAWVRWPDGSDDIVPGSQVQQPS
jgi:glyoxylase-like metal-dependent hydrolase (beta-lactamase superfamily II)